MIKRYDSISLALIYRYALDDEALKFVEYTEEPEYKFKIVEFDKFISQNTRNYSTCIKDLDRRVSAMIDILEHPRGNLQYQKKLTESLSQKCLDAGRADLSTKLEESFYRRLTRFKRNQ